MAVSDLKTFATMLAMYVQKNMAATHRGAMLIRCINDDTVVAAMFGNDNFSTDNHTRREVELVRQQLGQAALQELGFGLSPDGITWALLVRADTSRFHTPAGKAFHLEMFRLFLDDTVQGAWSSASGTPMPGSERLASPQSQPAG